MPPPDPPPPRDRILKCTKTEEFASLNGKKGADAGFRSRVGGRVYVKCTGWSGVGCEWAEMTEIQKKQNPTSVDRSRPRGHLGCKGGCLECKRELLGARKWPGSGDASIIFHKKSKIFQDFLKLDLFDHGVGGAGPVSLRGAQNRSFH